MSSIGVAVVAAGWAAGALLLIRLRTLPAAAADGAADAVAATSVIIPARDEAATLPLLLASLAAQETPPLEVLVVDDGSSDDTPAIAQAAGATVLTGSPPPPGWLGKPWACEQGVRAATGSTLVLLDADVTLAPDALGRLVGAHRCLTSDGLLSVQPFHEAGPGVEQLSALANLVPVMASGMGAPFRAGARSSVAFGPCLVTTSGALASVGGFEAARASVIEDVALARAFRRAGRPVQCLAGATTVRFRMYPGGWRSMVQGWTKSLAAGAGQAPLLPTLGATAWVVSLVVAAIAAVGSLAGLARGEALDLTAPLVWAVVAAQVGWALGRVGTFRWWCAALFPVPLLAFVAVFTRSLVLRALRRPVTWRGRRIASGSVVR